jgi:acetoin utilization deacetylase AcuC-like enzyme
LIAPCIQIFSPIKASDEMLCNFHSPEYIEFLKSVTPENKEQLMEQVGPVQPQILLGSRHMHAPPATDTCMQC